MQPIYKAFQGEADLTRMAELVREHPAEQIHLVDLPYRLASWAFDEPDNCVLWEIERGALAAWAVLQPPFWTIDYAIAPGAPPSLHAGLLEWADQRARAVQGTPFGHPAWFVNVFDWQKQRQHDLERAGFAPQTDVGDDSWSKVLFGRSGHEPIPTAASLPEGFDIRPLQGASEVAAYVALHRAAFGSENMTTAWRERTLRHPDYRADLDLVAVDSAGQLAAFCVGWFTPQGRDGRPEGQIEPFGVRADLRRAGIGRALLGECLRRMAELGAEHVAVETDNYRDAAFQFYQALGFAVEHNIVVYRKDYGDPT